MVSIATASDRKQHFKSDRNDSVIFNAKAVEITILDRWGRIVWKKGRGDSLEAIRWNGIDFFGEPVRAGSYLCKIVYSAELVVYAPFVFLQK